MRYNPETFPTQVFPGIYLIESEIHFHIASTFSGVFYVDRNDNELYFIETIVLPNS
jgi:hypothetical protein